VYRIAILIWSEFTALSTPDSENWINVSS
jgi:hypothetical protein